MPEAPPDNPQHTLLSAIIGALLLWALYVAVGVYRSTLNLSGALVVLASMGAFVGCWLLLLQSRNRKQ